MLLQSGSYPHNIYGGTTYIAVPRCQNNPTNNTEAQQCTDYITLSHSRKTFLLCAY